MVSDLQHIKNLMGKASAVVALHDKAIGPLPPDVHVLAVKFKDMCGKSNRCVDASVCFQIDGRAGSSLSLGVRWCLTSR